MTVLWKSFLALLLGAVVLAGCGGGGDDGGADAAIDVEGDLEVDTDNLGYFTSSRCADTLAAMGRAAASVGQIFTGGAESLEQSVAALRAAAEEAPSEIRAEFRIIAEGYATSVEAFAGSDWDPASGQAPPPEVMAAFNDLSETFESDEFQAASERVTDWFENDCGR